MRAVGPASPTVFIFGTDYLGRLCTYGQCPKGKVECLVPGCGQVLLLRQHEGFVLRHDVLAADRCMPLYERGRGILCRASDAEDANVRQS